MILLDTNVVSELVRSVPDRAVVEFLRGEALSLIAELLGRAAH
jgi:predicted nucleic acid-binding protein